MTLQGEGDYPLRLGRSLIDRVQEEAKKVELSVDELIVLAIAEKLSRMEHERWLKERKPNA